RRPARSPHLHQASLTAASARSHFVWAWDSFWSAWRVYLRGNPFRRGSRWVARNHHRFRISVETLPARFTITTAGRYVGTSRGRRHRPDHPSPWDGVNPSRLPL